MYVIMVYDVSVERVNKILKIGRRYLNWVQNSVLEGEMTAAQYAYLKSDVKNVIDREKDSVSFYVLRTTAYMKKETLGIEKNDTGNII